MVIGELTGPWVPAPDEWATLRRAQGGRGRAPDYKGSVRFVETHDFVRPAKESTQPRSWAPRVRQRQNILSRRQCVWPGDGHALPELTSA